MLSSQYTVQQNLQSGYAGIQIFEDINTSADQSVRVGEGAGKLSYGTGNAFVGYQAGEQNLAGSYDTFVGYQAGQLNQNSDSTTLIGAFAGRQNTSGSETVFVGFRAGEFNLNGNLNVGVGAYALRENSSGSSVTAVGWRAAERNLDGDYNTMIGAEAGQNNRSGNYNTMAGYQVGRAAFEGSENTFFGAYAGYSNEYGSDNCIIGFKAGLDVTRGSFNIAIGAYSLASGRPDTQAPSDCNVVIGAFTNATGSGNVVLGLNAGSNSKGDDNVLIGKDVALVYSGRKSVVVGAEALVRGSGECNTIIGYGVAPSFRNGSNNVFLGVGADTVTADDISYAIVIGTSNVQTYSHSIAIGDGLDNSRAETIMIGFDINSDAENSVLLGKSLNIRNATVFKDPLNYQLIDTIAARANEVFGPTTIRYSTLLNSSTGIIYPVAGAGQYTSNIVSSSGNPRRTYYPVPTSYDLLRANSAAYIHRASALIVDSYDEFAIPATIAGVLSPYALYGPSNFFVAWEGSNININSYSNLYLNSFTINLNYSISNVATNLTYFNTSNTTYPVYLQKLVQRTAYKSENTVFANNLASATDTVGYSVATDSTGNLYQMGLYTSFETTRIQNLDRTDSAYSFPRALGGQCCFLIKYDTEGDVTGATLVNGVSARFRGNVCMDMQDKAYIAGEYSITGVLSNLDGTLSAISLPAPITTNANACLVQYGTDGVVQGAASVSSVLPTTAYRTHVDSSCNIYLCGSYQSSNTAPISLYGLNGALYTKTLQTTPYESTNAFLIRYSSNGAVQSATSILGSSPTNPTDLTGGAYGRSVYTDVFQNLYLVGDYRNMERSNVLQNMDATNTNSPSNLPITSNVTGYMVRYSPSGAVSGLVTLASVSPYTNPLTNEILVRGSSDILDVSGDSLGNIYITGTYLSFGSVPLSNMDGRVSPYTLDKSSDAGVFLIRYNQAGQVTGRTTIDGQGNYTVQAGFNLHCDSSDNMYLTGIYNTTVPIGLSNLDGTPTQYTLPITQNGSAFMVAYSPSGSLFLAQRLDGPAFDAAFGISIDSEQTVYWTGTYLSSSAVPVYDLEGKLSDTVLPATSPISSSAFLIKYKQVVNLAQLEHGPLDGSIHFDSIPFNTTLYDGGISPASISSNNARVRYIANHPPRYGTLNQYIYNRSYLESIQANSSNLTAEIEYTPIYEYAYIHSNIASTDSLTLFPFLEIHNNSPTSNLYGITTSDNQSIEIQIANSLHSSNTAMRNAIVFPSDGIAHRHTFTSNDFIGIPYGFSEGHRIAFNSYTDPNLELTVPSTPFTYSNVVHGHVSIAQRAGCNIGVAYSAISGTLTDVNGSVRHFSIPVSTMPTRLLDIRPTYSILLGSSGYGGSNHISSTYPLPSIPLEKMWPIQTSSNNDLQIPVTGATNLNQATYRSIDPFLRGDTVRFVVQSNTYLQEVSVGFSNMPNYIYHTYEQAALTRDAPPFYTDMYQYLRTEIEIQNLRRIYTSNFSSNASNHTVALEASGYSFTGSSIVGSYDSSYGYSNTWTFDIQSNIYPIDKTVVGSNGLITVQYTAYTSNYVYSIDHTLVGDPAYSNYVLAPRFVSNIDPTISFTSNVVHSLCNVVLLTKASNYDYKTEIEIAEIQNLRRIYTSNFSSNASNHTVALEASGYSFTGSSIVGSYDSSYGYSNTWTFDIQSNIYPIDETVVGSDGLITIQYTAYTSNYVYSIDHTLVGDPAYSNYVLAPRFVSNIEPTISFTSNVVQSLCNVVLLTKASNYDYEKVVQIQNSFYYYGSVHGTYQSLLLYTSNTASNVSASNVSIPRTLTSITDAPTGSRYSSNTTLNQLRFHEYRTSNAVIPMTRAMMYREGGSYQFQAPCGFSVVRSNVGVLNTWNQNLIEGGSLYLQLPPGPLGTLGTSNIVRELGTGSAFTSYYRLYNALSELALDPDPINLCYTDRYTVGGNTVRGVYRIDRVLQSLQDSLGALGFVPTRYHAAYLDQDVDVMLLDSSLVQTTTIDVTGGIGASSAYIARRNQNNPGANLYLFAANSTTATNIFTIPIVFCEVPSIPRQGFNYGISVGSKNLLDPGLFYHSWSNLPSQDLKISITSTLAGASYRITSNSVLLTDANKTFTYADCLGDRIHVQPLDSNLDETITYDLVKRPGNITLYHGLTFGILSYDYYAFPSSSEVQRATDASLTTILYASNQVENVFSDVFSSYIDNYRNSLNVAPNRSDLGIYIERFPQKGVLYSSTDSNIPYMCMLDKKLRYLSYTPDDIQHDQIDIRLVYKPSGRPSVSNVSPVYRIALSNYAVPLLNLPVEVGSRASNVPISYFVGTSASNLQRFLADGNTFSSNTVPVPWTGSYVSPPPIYSFPITLRNRYERTLASTRVNVEPFALSAIPVLSSKEITIGVNQYSISSLKPLLGIIREDYPWNRRADFVLTIPSVEGLSLMARNGVIMKKSYMGGALQLDPVSHFTRDELLEDQIVYAHIGEGSVELSDSFTCYTTAGEYAYNTSLITVNLDIYPLPYVRSVADDYVYYNTTHAASNGFNPLKGVIQTVLPAGTRGTRYASLGIVASNNIEVFDSNLLRLTSNFSIDDLENGKIGYRIRPEFLNVRDFTNPWPFSLTIVPNGNLGAGYTNELATIPAYADLFRIDMRGTMNIYESSNLLLAPPSTNQILSYTFDSSNAFGSNPIDIQFQLKPSQSISTIGMTPTEYIDSSNLRTFELNIAMGTTPNGTDILDATLTEKMLTLRTPYNMLNSNETYGKLFDQWNTIEILTIDPDNDGKTSIIFGGISIPLNRKILTNQLKSITISANEASPSNLTPVLYRTDTVNPFGGDLPISYQIGNYVTSLYLRNFEIDIFTPFNSGEGYDPTTTNVVLGKVIGVKGADNIAIGKQFSTSGKNNIIVGNYIGVDRNALTSTNDIYESIVIGNNSFINGRIQNIIAIGNSNLNDLSGVDPDRINEFISHKPIVIGNTITSEYIDYNVNLGNTFLRTDVGTSQVYLGLKNEKVAIGYDENMRFSQYQDLYVAHGVSIGGTGTSSNQYALDVYGSVNIAGTIYQNGTQLLDKWQYAYNQSNAVARPDAYINTVVGAGTATTTGPIYFNSITSDRDANLYVLGSYNCGIPFDVPLFNLDGTRGSLSLPSTYYGFTNLGTTCLLKYNSTGRIIAMAIINSQFYDSGKGVCADRFGNIYTTGYYMPNYNATTEDLVLHNLDTVGTTNNAGGYRLAGTNFTIGAYVVKYGDDGTVQGATSITSYFSSNIGNAVCTDGSNVYAVGDYNSFYLDPITLQPPNPYAPIPLPIGLSNLDGTASAHYLPGTNYQHDGYIIRYNQAGVVQASTTIIGPNQMPDPANPGSNIGLGTASLLATCTDEAQNLYVGGMYIGYTNVPLSNLDFPNTPPMGYQLPMTFGQILPSYTPTVLPAAFLVKYGPDGIIQGATSIFSPVAADGNSDNRILSIHADIGCNVYAAGTYTASGDSEIQLFNLDGTASAYTLPMTQVPSSFLLKYDSTGNLVGSMTINGMGIGRGVSVCSDTKGYAYLTGTYNSPDAISLSNLYGTVASSNTLPGTISTRTYVLKYSSNGALANATSIDTNPIGIQNTKYDNALCIYCDHTEGSSIQDNMYLTGIYTANRTVGLYNLDTDRTLSSYSLPAYSGQTNAAYLVQYKNSKYIDPVYDFNLPTIYVGQGSNVGIGTSFVPYGTMLYVVGNEYVSDTLTASNINFTGSLLYNGQPYNIGGQWTTSGNDIYYDAGSVGIRKIPNDLFSMDVLGNINFTGNLYQNGILYPIGGYGDGSNASNIWVHSCNVASVVVPGAGAVSYSPASNAIFRHCDNDIEYAFDLTFTITSGSGGVGDYGLSVPFEVDTGYYLGNSILGTAWALISSGSLSNFFPVSLRAPSGGDTSNVIMRFVNGTAESSFSALPSGTTVHLGGMVSYVSTSIFPTIGMGRADSSWTNSIYGIYSSNHANIGIGTSIPKYSLDVNGSINFASNLYQRDILIDLTSINLATSNINKVNPWILTPESPTLAVPSPGVLSYSSASNSIYRHIDNDVEYMFNLTVGVSQASGAGDYKISLPVPFNSNYYVPNTIVGSVWARVISNGLSNYIPASLSTISGSQSNCMAVRFINGTTETPLSVLPAGSSLQLSGSIDYVSSVYPRSGIFLSNVCYQDDYGHVGFNTFGPLQGQVDVVTHEAGRTALYVENTGTGAISLLMGSGNVGIGTMMPRGKLDVVGSAIVSANIGIGITNPSYQLQLSLDSAAKPTTTAWTVSSDARVKEEIQGADLDRCYEVVRDLRLCRFRWNSNYLPNVGDRHMLGWIAQEVEPFIPNAVTRTSNYGLPDAYGLDSDQIIKFMYGTIQKNMQTIERLEQEVAGLKGFIASKFDDFRI